MDSVIAGYGEVGQAVYQVMNDQTFIIDLNTPLGNVPKHVDILHICFPSSKHFVTDVKNYIKICEPKHIIVWSSIPIGTCAEIGDFVIHSPVEGKHPRLADSIRKMVRWVACQDVMERQWAAHYFSDKGLLTKLIKKTEYTEALKLLSTTEYGVNIVFADYKKRVADAVNMPYGLTKKWNEDYNDLYRSLGMNQFQKFLLDPPNGRIGGHCILSNVKLLTDSYPDKILDLLKEYE